MQKWLKWVFALSLIGFAGCMILVGAYLASNQAAGRELQALKKRPNAETAPVTDAVTHYLPPEHTAAVIKTPLPAASDSPAPSQAYTADRLRELQQTNGDLMGWLTIEDTPVDLPVMHTPSDPQFYLDHDFQKRYSRMGTPFLDGEASIEPCSQNLVVYGHNMRDGHIFGSLNEYRKQEYVQAHPTINLETVAFSRHYQVFGVVAISSYEDEALQLVRWKEGSMEAPAALFLEKVLARSVIEPLMIPDENDHFLTLVTCEYTHSDGRLLVFAFCPKDGPPD